MKLENAIRILAGTMLLTSLGLAHWVSQWWLLLAVFVGVNLIQSALAGFCPADLEAHMKLSSSKSAQITA